MSSGSSRAISTTTALRPARPARPGLLPERRPGPGPARDEHRVQAADVHAQLQGGGGGQAGDVPVAQRLLQRPPVLAQVTGPVGRDPLAVAGRSRLAQRPARAQGDGLGAAPGPGERQHRDRLGHQVGQQGGGLTGGAAPHRRAGLAAGAGERRLPQAEGDRPARRGVLGHLLGPLPGQQERAAGGLADRGGGEQEDRSGARWAAGPGLARAGGRRGGRRSGAACAAPGPRASRTLPGRCGTRPR